MVSLLVEGGIGWYPAAAKAANEKSETTEVYMLKMMGLN